VHPSTFLPPAFRRPFEQVHECEHRLRTSLSARPQ